MIEGDKPKPGVDGLPGVFGVRFDMEQEIGVRTLGSVADGVADWRPMFWGVWHFPIGIGSTLEDWVVMEWTMERWKKKHEHHSKKFFDSMKLLLTQYDNNVV